MHYLRTMVLYRIFLKQNFELLCWILVGGTLFYVCEINILAISQLTNSVNSNGVRIANNNAGLDGIAFADVHL
jgi:hypothetical protein